MHFLTNIGILCVCLIAFGSSELIQLWSSSITYPTNSGSIWYKICHVCSLAFSTWQSCFWANHMSPKCHMAIHSGAARKWHHDLSQALKLSRQEKILYFSTIFYIKNKIINIKIIYKYEQNILMKGKSLWGLTEALWSSVYKLIRVSNYIPPPILF